MKYDVHVYAIVRVKVTDIEAETQEAAVEKAENRVFELGEELFLRSYVPIEDIGHTEWAEDIHGFLVDEHGDSEYERTQAYTSNKKPAGPYTCLSCGQEPPKPGG